MPHSISPELQKHEMLVAAHLLMKLSERYPPGSATERELLLAAKEALDLAAEFGHRRAAG